MDSVQDEKITQQIMVEFSKTVELFGLNPLEARLFSYLYLSRKALTLDDMSEALGKSKTSMSTNIRSLLDLNLVTRVWKKGVRKDLYEANSSLFKSFMSFYINKWMDAANHQKEALEEIEKLIDKDAKETDPSTDTVDVTHRLKEIIEFHNQLVTLFKKIEE
ncbi:GbsR/MarR family transcriptional regulator [Oceanobacillus halophilus]|uniref:HTH-type transcriptional regulator n=1 Tax=Oceanobacillus halophilus TaxID=930130 RepID=A0A494ZX46_9BACI|nr:MarR family transcriptional regulator [Oceanobacillus halophilus]RKQ31276.1 transcriptional regulator [Oceanobacillus halophilus]